MEYNGPSAAEDFSSNSGESQYKTRELKKNCKTRESSLTKFRSSFKSTTLTRGALFFISVSGKDEESHSNEETKHEMKRYKSKSKSCDGMERKTLKEHTNLLSADHINKQPRVTLPSNKEPTFYIGGGNGVALINSVMEEMGWRRIDEKLDDKFRLKWTETKSAVSYASFKEGEQMVNHFPNCNLLTNKMGLLNTLQNYERQYIERKGKLPKLKLTDFVPETYRLDDLKDREAFFNSFSEGEIWICKPTGRNQGKGIYLVRNKEEIKQLCRDHDNNRKPGKPLKPMNRIIQKYISNPLLIDKRKFDIRCYMLIANAVPYLVLFHHGYIRLTIHDYDNSSENLVGHLTNQYIQKKDPTYKAVKEDTTWSMARFNDYINQYYAKDNDLPLDWVYTTLTPKIKYVMQHCFTCVKPKLEAKLGYFELYGYDFMVDSNFNVFLIEININPCLATNCEALKERIPEVVKESLHLSVECFEKSRRNRPLQPLQSLKNFEIIYQGPSPRPRGQRGTTSSSPSRPLTRQHKDNQSPVRVNPKSYPKKTSSPLRSMDSRAKDSNSSNRITSRDQVDIKPLRPTTETPAGLVTVEEDGCNDDTEDVDKGIADESKEEHLQTEEHPQRKVESKSEPSKRTKRNVPEATRTTYGNAKDNVAQDKSRVKVDIINKPTSYNKLQTTQIKLKAPKESTKEMGKPVTLSSSQSRQPYISRKSVFPILTDNSSSPYAAEPPAVPDPVKLRMTHGANSPNKKTKSQSKELEVNNRGS